MGAGSGEKQLCGGGAMSSGEILLGIGCGQVGQGVEERGDSRVRAAIDAGERKMGAGVGLPEDNATLSELQSSNQIVVAVPFDHAVYRLGVAIERVNRIACGRVSDGSDGSGSPANGDGGEGGKQQGCKRLPVKRWRWERVERGMGL